MTVREDFAQTIGRTPLLRLRRASEATGCEILGKAEFLNPGGSIKDRTALGLLGDAERRALVRPGTTLIEGTAGNTGIGLALLGASRGYRTIIVMPQTQSAEKIDAVRLTGADVRLVPEAKFADPGHYVHRAERLCEEMNAVRAGSAWFANQFDNVANRQIHARVTGPEIWDDVGGRIDGFVCSAGTGGSLAGIAEALKARNPKIVTALADPGGSALAHFVEHGELKAQGNSITEGIGSSRISANFEDAPLDCAWSIPDAESVPLLHDLLYHEGLCLGGSTGVNIAGAIRLARRLGPGHTIVTLLADAGARYRGKLYSPAFLRSRDIPVPDWIERAFGA